MTSVAIWRLLKIVHFLTVYTQVEPWLIFE